MIVRRFQFQLKTAAYGNDSGKRGVFARREAIPCGEESPPPLIRTACRDDLARLKNKVGRPAAGRKPYEKKMMKILEGKKNDSEEVLFNK